MNPRFSLAQFSAPFKKGAPEEPKKTCYPIAILNQILSHCAMSIKDWHRQAWVEIRLPCARSIPIQKNWENSQWKPSLRQKLLKVFLARKAIHTQNQSFKSHKKTIMSGFVWLYAQTIAHLGSRIRTHLFVAGCSFYVKRSKTPRSQKGSFVCGNFIQLSQDPIN